jgi:hypothetical protein
MLILQKKQNLNQLNLVKIYFFNSIKLIIFLNIASQILK